MGRFLQRGNEGKEDVCTEQYQKPLLCIMTHLMDIAGLYVKTPQISNIWKSLLSCHKIRITL